MNIAVIVVEKGTNYGVIALHKLRRALIIEDIFGDMINLNQVPSTAET